jgi:hypothetical protein
MVARCASRLETLMMQPPWRRPTICLPTTLHPQITLVRLVSSSCSAASSLVRMSRESCVSPAQLTRMSMSFFWWLRGSPG